MEHFHSVHIRAFLFDIDFIDRFKSQVSLLCGSEFSDNEKKGIKLQLQEIREGVDKPFNLLSVSITRKKSVNEVKRAFANNLSASLKKQILETLESRLDDEYRFFLRFDLHEFLKGNLKLIDGGECVHLTLPVACYPKTRTASISSIKDYFEKYGN